VQRSIDSSVTEFSSFEFMRNEEEKESHFAETETGKLQLLKEDRFSNNRRGG